VLAREGADVAARPRHQVVGLADHRQFLGTCAPPGQRGRPLGRAGTGLPLLTAGDRGKDRRQRPHLGGHQPDLDPSTWGGRRYLSPAQIARTGSPGRGVPCPGGGRHAEECAGSGRRPPGLATGR
jgi:hypothetical protein